MKSILFVLVSLLPMIAAHAGNPEAVRCIGLKKGNSFGVRVIIEGSQGSQFTFSGDGSYSEDVWFFNQEEQKKGKIACASAVTETACAKIEPRRWDRTFHEPSDHVAPMVNSTEAGKLSFSNGAEGLYFAHYESCVESRADKAVTSLAEVRDAAAKQRDISTRAERSYRRLVWQNKASDSMHD